MKRFISFILCLLVTVTFFNVSAQTGENQKNAKTVEENSLHGFTYDEYLAENNDFSYETKEIKMKRGIP